jgi:hypothetical protein
MENITAAITIIFFHFYKFVYWFDCVVFLVQTKIVVFVPEKDILNSLIIFDKTNSNSDAD